MLLKMGMNVDLHVNNVDHQHLYQHLSLFLSCDPNMRKSSMSSRRREHQRVGLPRTPNGGTAGGHRRHRAGVREPQVGRRRAPRLRVLPESMGDLYRGEVWENEETHGQTTGIS